MKCILVIVALVTCLLVGAAAGQQLHYDNTRVVNRVFALTNQDVRPIDGDDLTSLGQSGVFNENTITACGNEYLSDRIQPQKDQEIQVADSSTCSRLEKAGNYYDGSLLYHQAYDTLRAFVEQCYATRRVYLYFFTIGSECYGMAADGDTLFGHCRAWYKDVLYLSNDSNYYCEDLAAYAGTFEAKDEYGNLPNFKTELAILTYLVDSTHCPSYRADVRTAWKNYHMIWQDSVKDSTLTPFDSTIPTIDQAGQSFLRGFAAGVEPGSLTVESDPLGDLVAVENPFKQELDLKYTTTKPTIAKVEIYDALGRQLWTDGLGYLDPGDHSVQIATHNWTSGTYYARLVTIHGEVKSVKLIKQ